jgi:hypothetical protein
VKVLFVALAILTAWGITTTIRNRNNIDYLRNQVAQLKNILIKLEKNGKKERKET